jgi:hypothetical protein
VSTLSDLKCEFEDINLPCTFCQRDGRICVKEFGPAAQQLQSPIENMFTVDIPSEHSSLTLDQDSQYIQYFERMHLVHADAGTYISVGTQSIPFLPTHRLPLCSLSETFRPIFLALAAFMEATKTTDITRKYLDQFDPRFTQAIEEQKYIDVFYSGYTNIIFSFMSGVSIPTVINQCTRLWNTYYKLQQGSEFNIDDNELSMMESLLQIVLRSLILQNDCINLRDRRTWIEPMDNMLAFLDTCDLNVYKPLVSLSPPPSGLATGIVTLAIHLHFRLDQYFFLASPLEGNSEHVNSREQMSIRMMSLKVLLNAITTTIEELDCPEVRGIRDQLYHSSNVAYLSTLTTGTGRFIHFPDIPPPENAENFRYHHFALVVLYHSALLLANTLWSDPPNKNTTIAYSAAISLCRLCSMYTICNCLAVRSLLFAGLILTEDVHRESMRMTVV